MTLSATTRIQANNVDLESVYPYWLWYPDEQVLALAKTQPKELLLNDSNYPSITDPYTGANEKCSARYYYFIGTPNSLDNCIVLHYLSDLDTWEIRLPFTAYVSPTRYQIMYGFQDSSAASSVTKRTVYTNGYTISHTSGGIKVFNVTTSLPSSMPEVNIGLPDINAAINDALNATTSTTTQANYIQEMININLDQYNQGNITLTDMKSILEGTSSMLDSLSNQSGNTLSDQIAINNAQNTINNAQNALQIEQDNELSQAIIERITSIWQLSPEMANYITLLTDLERTIREYWIQPYINGELTKDQVLISGTDTLPSLLEIRSGEIDILLSESSTQADFELVNHLKDMLDTAIDVINSAGDVDKDISNNFQTSDEYEMNYLDELASETTATISDLSPLEQFTYEEKNATRTILDIIWNNRFIKDLLVVCGCFMVVCVVLGIRYKI